MLIRPGGLSGASALSVPFSGQAVDEDLHVRHPLELRRKRRLNAHQSVLDAREALGVGFALGVVVPARTIDSADKCSMGHRNAGLRHRFLLRKTRRADRAGGSQTSSEGSQVYQIPYSEISALPYVLFCEAHGRCGSVSANIDGYLSSVLMS
jgi:hypothetical protein